MTQRRRVRLSLWGRRRRGGDERGTVLIEAALVLPIIMMLTFGMLEMGLFFKDSLTVSEVAKNSAHTGAQWAQDPAADYYIIQSVNQASSALNGNVVEVVVYDAAAPSPSNVNATNVPAACLTPAATSAGGVSVSYTDSGGVLHSTGGIGSCNIYTAANGDFTRPVSDWTGATPIASSQFWPGNVRLENTTDTRYPGGTPGPDYVGVWVKTTHTWTTGIVQSTPTAVTDQAVFRIEPRQ